MPPAARLRPSARRLASGALLLAVSAVAGCGGDREAGAGVDDTALARDLSLANRPVAPDLPDSLAFGDTAAVTRPLPAAPSAPEPTLADEPVPSPRASAAPRQVAVAPRPAPARRPAPAPAEPESGAPEPSAPLEAASSAPVPAVGGAAAGAGAGRSLAAGTELAGTLAQRVCSESSRPGDRFVATLGADVSGPTGVVLPAGTPLVLEVARVAGDPPTAEFLVRGVSIDGEFLPVVADASPVTGGVERREVVDKAGSSKGKAIQGAIAGAILGRVLGGGGRATVIGAAGGAAAGAAMGRERTHQETCVAGGAPVRVRLTERLTVR